MSVREYTCVVCPNGCPLRVDVEELCAAHGKVRPALAVVVRRVLDEARAVFCHQARNSGVALSAETMREAGVHAPVA